jgi:hypothetical protein
MIGVASAQHPWLAVAITAALGGFMTLFAYLFWRRHGPKSWYGKDNQLLAYLGRNALVLAIFFYSLTLFLVGHTIRLSHPTGNPWTFVLEVVGTVAFAVSALLMLVMWFAGKPRVLIPPVFRKG